MSFAYIKKSTALSITADKADPAFPASYALTEHTRQVWKSTDGTGTLTIAIEAFTSGVFIYSANAETVTITVKNSSGTTVIIPEKTYDMLGVTTLEEFMSGRVEHRSPSIWVDFGLAVTEDAQLVVALSKSFADSVPISCGLVFPGEIIRTAHCVEYTFNEDFVDYSDVQGEPLNNGAIYVLPRDTAGIYSGFFRGSWQELRKHYNNFRYTIGSRGFAVNVSDTVAGIAPAMFCGFNGPPKKDISNYNWSKITFSLKERI